MAVDAEQNTVELSIVIATYNRAKMLGDCLAALFRQSEPLSAFEVVVVVDGSTDHTCDMLDRMAAPCHLRVIRQANQGQAAALNRGVEASTGKYCLFLDDDIVADSGLVSAHLDVHKTQSKVIALGHLSIEIPARSDGFTRYYGRWWAGHYSRLDQGLRLPKITDCFSGNLSVHRDAFLAVGGFATDLQRGYDIELGYRLVCHGLSLVYVPHAKAKQIYSKNCRDIVRDAEKEGEGDLEMWRRHPSLLAQLPIGAFCEDPSRGILTRRLLLALHVPVTLLIVMGLILERGRFADVWYRFLYSYCYWRGIQNAVADDDMWRRLTSGTVVLMYHAFGTVNEPPSRYVIPSRRFKQQMRWLRIMRYHILDLEYFLNLHRSYRLPPPRSVIITIDDGYTDVGTVAYPILRRYGIPATVFLVSRVLGKSSHWNPPGALANRRVMSVEDIRALAQGGISLGAHTRTHPRLPEISPEEMKKEVEGSRADLEQLGIAIETFAYPFGKCDRISQTIVEQTGFLGACGVRPGFNTPATPYSLLRRVEIRGTESLIRFALALLMGQVRESRS